MCICILLAMCLDFVIVLYKWDLAYVSVRWGFNSWEKKTCISENIHTIPDSHISG